ncbi:MAG: hypothetical protein EPO42_11105 [Gallionellaceae bacterium]|nr:MAG: hypothetical protein EPO42_11105 [Gallionellaceae bacterium]
MFRYFWFVMLAGMLLGQTAAAEPDGFIHRPALIRGSFEQLALPANESMGMLGVNYLLETLPHLYVGGAAYGALTGQRGGFFTVGTEVAWHQKLFQQWEWQAGLYAGGGGGGGATALVGGGLMLRPHVDLMWDFGAYRAGLSASSVSFPSGQISSNQLGLVFSADTEFLQLDPLHLGEPPMVRQRSGVGFDRVHAVAGIYQGQVFARSGTGNTIGLVGFRMEQMRSAYSFWGIEAAGAASGGAAGYAEFLGTVGVEAPMLEERAAIGARVAAGMGGGGAVSVGGGQLYKLGGYATVNLSRDTHLSLEGGYAAAPDGQLRARYAVTNLTMDLDHPDDPSGDAQINRYEGLLGANRYAATAHKDGSVSVMDVVALKVNRYIGDTIYLSGQAHSAFQGKEGGYSAGLFGVGMRFSGWFDRVALGAEMLLGAAGGGGVESSGGAIVAPNAYLDWQLDDWFTLRLGSGRIKSLGGALDSQSVNVAIKFSYAAASR